MSIIKNTMSGKVSLSRHRIFATGLALGLVLSISGVGYVPAAAAQELDGGQLYNTYCAICHKAGLNAAPKHGSKPLWAKRIAQGRDTMYANAINGLRGMPPRGGFPDLTDDEVKAATDFMVRAAGGWGD